MLPKMLTVAEVALVARAPRSTVEHWIYDGKLRGVKVGRRRLVSELDLARFLGVLQLPRRRPVTVVPPLSNT